MIELIYAVNKTDTPDPFDLRRLGLGGALERGPSPISAAAMLAMEGGTAATLEVIEAVKVVLAANRPAMTYPSLASLLATETGRLVGAFLAFLGLMIIAGVILQQALFFALLMVGGWILWTIIGRKRAERVAVTRVEKTLSWGLTASVMGLLGKGMLGLDGEVGGEARSEFVLFGWSATLPCRFRTSEPSLQTCLVLLIPPVACGIALVAYKYIQGRQLTRELEVRRNASVS